MLRLTIVVPVGSSEKDSYCYGRDLDPDYQLPVKRCNCKKTKSRDEEDMGYLDRVEDVVLDLINMVTQMEQDDQGIVFTKETQEEYLINMPDHEHAYWLEIDDSYVNEYINLI